jgi:prepilin-type N-terminal cleavage/methylation domain
MGARGQSLIEVILAITIIGIALVPASRMWVASSQATVATDRQAAATNLAQRILEAHFRNVAYAKQVPLSGTDAGTGLAYRLTLEPMTLPAGYTPKTLRRGRVVVTEPGSPQPIAQLHALTAQEADR